LNSTNPDIVGVCESWLHPDVLDSEIAVNGYSVFRKDRAGRKGGGCLLYIKDCFTAREITLCKEQEFTESVWCTVCSENGEETLEFCTVHQRRMKIAFYV
jgi:hypothetical protein